MSSKKKRIAIVIKVISLEFFVIIGLHLEIEFSRVAVPFNSTYSTEPTFTFKCPIIPIVSEIKHAHCCVLNYQSNPRSCAVTQLSRYLPWSAGTRVTIVRTLVPDKVALCDKFKFALTPSMFSYLDSSKIISHVFVTKYGPMVVIIYTPNLTSGQLLLSNI